MKEKIIEFVDKEKRKLCFFTVIASMLIHFQLYALMITGPDTLINSMYHQADIWEAMLLRFGLDFVQMLKGNIVSPILATLISSIFLGISVILVIDILEIKNKFLKYLIALVFTVAPNISAALSFFYCSDAYMLGMLLAIIPVLIIRKSKNKNFPILVGGLLIALAMGMYQTYLSVTMVLCIATLIIDILNKKETKEIFISLFKYMTMGIIGIILFYLISYITIILKNLQVSAYNGADSIGFATLLNIFNLLPESYQSFFNYFFNDKILPNTIWNTNLFYIVIFSVALISILYIIIKEKIYKNIVNIILICIFIIISPVCFGIIEIIVPDVNIHILMACSMIYIIPIFLKIIEMLPKTKKTWILKYFIIVCTIGITWNYTWQDNASYIAIKSMQNQAESTVLKLVTRIEQLEGYNPQMPVLFLGGLENNSYLSRKNTQIEAKKLFDRTWGFIANNSTIWWGNLDSWRKILYEYIGVNMNLVSEWECTDIFNTEEYKNMKYYPEKGSIKIINNTVVVKLSD